MLSRSSRLILPILLLVILVILSANAGTPDSKHTGRFTPPAELVPCGHSHNDYTRKRPLYDALNNGFCSIEIDVFLRKNDLIVSHTRAFLGLKKNIETLYLEPLKAIIDNNGGTVYPGDSTQLVLMIDFKTAGTPTYEQLKKIIEPYKAYLVSYNGETENWGALKLVISGSKPWETLPTETIRYASIDGGIGQRAEKWSTAVMPRVSSNYGKVFKWKGNSDMPKEEQNKLNNIVNEAHANGRKVRFWAMPHNENVWHTFLSAGVDWINVDDLEKFRQYYLQFKEQQKSAEPQPSESVH